MLPDKSRQLRQQDLHRLLEVVPHLYAPCEATRPAFAPDDRSMLLAYPAPATEWIEAIINVIYASVAGVVSAAYNVLNLKTGDLEATIGRRRPIELSVSARQDLIAHGTKIIHADPAYRRGRELLPSGNVLIDSDMHTRQDLESSRAYTEYYRPCGVRFQMAFAVPSTVRDRITFVNAMRWDKPFTERDRSMGMLLQHHIQQAYLSRPSRTVMTHALESRDPSVLESLGLSPRQTEVLYWLACGKRDTETATILGTSFRTINHHVAAIYERLGVENRASAIRIAMETALQANE
jgi:DNA-binding NarL/FixJ family response regulator